MELGETILKIAAVFVFAVLCGHAIDEGSESGIAATVAMFSIAFGFAPIAKYIRDNVEVKKKKKEE